jgi:hypothetical protein
MDSNPTPRALVVDSYEPFITLKKQNKTDNLQKSDQLQNTFSNSRENNKGVDNFDLQISKTLY